MSDPVQTHTVDTTPVSNEPTGPIEHGEIVTTSSDDAVTETVTAPAKVMRIGSMVKQLLEEVKGTDLDEASRERLAEIYERSIVELAEALSPDLQQELRMLTLPFKDGTAPTSGEIRVAHAQLVGWLEGLFHGIQATLFAQQLAARQQFEQMRGIAPGSESSGIDPRLMAPRNGPRAEDGSANDRPGTYL
ncbi:MAG: hypothetical protein JWN62_156 [Acidimicrobiales bacterium]|jgi:hypothetical protein|nr:hypothetical protein [Acidimicrobiales bacterium]